MIKLKLPIIISMLLINYVHTGELNEIYMKTSQLDDQNMSGAKFSYATHSGFPSDVPLDTKSEEEYIKSLYNLGFDGSVEKYPYAAGYGHGNNYDGKLLSGGRAYNLKDSSKYGDKIQETYNNIGEFEKKLNGAYNIQDSKSTYNVNGGSKGGAIDIGGNYGHANVQGAAVLGGSFSQDNGHKKGSKTTGYHRVYGKNDYNKQHKFYDKADRRGHFIRYGNYDAKKGSVNGYFLKDGQSNRQNLDQKYIAKGAIDRGNFDRVAKVVKAANGNDGYYTEYADYDRKRGNKNSSKQGDTLTR